MIDKHPTVIARCADIADIMSAVRFGRENDLLTSIRGGGHNAGGLGVCDDGLAIDLSRMKNVYVDPRAKTVRVAPGCVWGDVDHAAHAFGMATPSGDDNPDRFWAIRGGGGNFGVVTSFLFRTHPVDTVYAGPTFWSLDQTEEVMKAYREFILKAPEFVYGFFAFLTIPPAPMFPAQLHNQKVCGVMWCCTGAPDEAEKATRPLRSIGKPVLDHVGPVPFPMVQSLFDALYPPGLQWYWRADFFKEISGASIAEHAKHGAKLPTMHSTMHLYPIDGAAHRVGAEETAFSYRDANWAGVIVGVDPDPANRDKITKWTRDYFDALHPYSSGGAYVNFMMDEGQERVQASFRDNYERLAQIKTKYDPRNLFRVNQNIRPVGAV